MTVTLDINGRRVQVDDAFRSLTPDRQQEVVNEIAASIGVSGSGRQQEPSSMQWVNRGIAGGIDSLVGLANALPNAAIRGGASVLGIEDPFQFGTTPTAELMDMAGIRAQREPDTLLEHFLVGIGEGASALVPTAAGARALAATPGAVGAVARPIAESFTRTPAAAIATELLAGGGGRVGGEVAGAENEALQPLGALGGALVASLGPGAAARGLVGGVDAATRYLPGIALLRSVAAREMAPFTERGAREIASRSLRGAASDPDAAAAAIRSDSLLTPAQQTGDVGLMGIERTAIERNPALRPEFEARGVEALRGLSDEAGAIGGDVRAAQDYLGGRVEGLRARIDARIAAAEAEAARRIEALSPQRAASENSVIVREEIEKAYKAAKAEENRLWADVPEDIEIPTENAKAALREAMELAGPVSAESIPAKARLWLGSNSGFGDTAPIRDVQRLYSDLRQVARNARGGQEPDAFAASLSDRLADGILADFDMVPDAAGEAYRTARAYTAQMKEAFGQGAVGRARQRTGVGGAAMAPEVMLDRTIGAGGARGAVGVDDISRVAGTPETQDALADYLRGRLSGRGAVTPQRLDAFERSYSEVLDRVSPVARALTEAREGMGAAERTASRYGPIAEALSEAPAARLAGAQRGKEMAEAVFSSNDPVESAARLAAQARRDPAAREGLKGGAVEYLMDRARGSFLPSGDRSVSGNTLHGLLQDDTTRAAMGKILDADEMTRLDRIAREFQALEASRTVKAKGDVVDSEPNRWISYIGGTMAARFGAQLGAGTSGASLRTSSEATKQVNRIMRNLTGNRAERLIVEAIQDPDLFKALLSGTNDADALRQIDRAMSRWFEGYAASELSRANEGDE